MKLLLISLFLICLYSYSSGQKRKYNLDFNKIPEHWDEGIPLGNGWIGCLVWQKAGQLRLSLDRVDLWDDRPMPKIDQLKFSWVQQQVAKKDYEPVQILGDEPYEQSAAPSKIPGAALQFDISKLGRVINVHLDIQSAINTITFDSGIRFKTYVNACKQRGYFSFENIKGQKIIPNLDIPAYADPDSSRLAEGRSSNLTRLGYKRGRVSSVPGTILYHQPTFGNNFYEVLVQWEQKGHSCAGTWQITNGSKAAGISCRDELFESHLSWWKDYWAKSSLSLPDTILDRQYKLEMYKFGCVTRADTPPISLQAIWTADDGNLPPWKGDLHHDLNTEMSYWAGYAANHLDLTSSLTNWLWKVKDENKIWTKAYFGVAGLNLPGVSTLTGKPMGGWIQYAMSPTISTWMAHHFYLQWQYSMDREFLKNKCIPYFKEIDKYLDGILRTDPVTGFKMLPLSSSPEYEDNKITAWFQQYSNYDLALIKNFYIRYNEANAAMQLPSQLINKDKQLPPFSTTISGLSIAPGIVPSFSHRHLSHLMAIYPLGLLSKNIPDQKIVIENSLKNIEKYGSHSWLGFTFPWASIIYSKAGNADSAVVKLRKFATNYCSSNSFHLNGDQKNEQSSRYTYRPFTLEANFGFAEAVHQLLLQSDQGFIDVFPAVQSSWQEVSFKNLRAQGAFLISAVRKDGKNLQVRVISEKGGRCKLKLPFNKFKVNGLSKGQHYITNNHIVQYLSYPGQIVDFTNL